jgi:hypothetical protein
VLEEKPYQTTCVCISDSAKVYVMEADVRSTQHFRRFMKHPYSSKYVTSKVKRHYSDSMKRYQSLMQVEELKLQEKNSDKPLETRGTLNSSYDELSDAALKAVEGVGKVYSLYVSPHSTINFRYSRLQPTSAQQSPLRSKYSNLPTPRTKDESIQPSLKRRRDSSRKVQALNSSFSTRGYRSRIKAPCN